MIVTTTNTVEGASIARYLDPISKNVVLGSNVFSDLGASITDFFGGRSNIYENKLSRIYVDVIDALKREATLRRADALLGLAINIDEISGSGKQMFMITATATPVIFKEAPVSSSHTNNTVSGDLLADKVRAKRLIDENPTIYTVTNKDISLILRTAFDEFAPLVAKFIDDDLTKYPDLKEKQEKLLTYFRFADGNFAKKYLYELLKDSSHTDQYRSRVLTLVRNFGLIDYNSALELLKTGDNWAKKAAVYIFREQTDIVTQDDISAMKNIYGDGLIKEFSEDVEYKTDKGILGTKEVWTCKCGSSVKRNDNTCSQCGRDKRGFILSEISPEEVQQLINDRIDILNNIL